MCQVPLVAKVVWVKSLELWALLSLDLSRDLFSLFLFFCREA